MMQIEENHYLIIDFEATCSNNNTVPRDEMEIIEIGALLLDQATFEIVSEFQTFIQPVRHPVLTPFCMDLTTIRQTDVDTAPVFVEALAVMQNWLEPFDSFRFCSWGDYDRKQLHRDCSFHRAPYPFPGGHTNLKTAVASALNLRKPTGIGRTLRHLGLTFQGTAHRGIDDVRNIARIVRMIRLCETP